MERLIDNNYKKACGMHLKHKIPELKNAGSSNLIPNIALGALSILTILFAVVGYLTRKRYNYLTRLIEKELGENEKKNK